MLWSEPRTDSEVKERETDWENEGYFGFYEQEKEG